MTLKRCLSLPQGQNSQSTPGSGHLQHEGSVCPDTELCQPDKQKTYGLHHDMCCAFQSAMDPGFPS